MIGFNLLTALQYFPKKKFIRTNTNDLLLIKWEFNFLGRHLYDFNLY